MVFPKNNLPVESQPWTRDVEKRVVNLESSFRSAEVNNVTRDSQALSQIRRLDVAVTDVGLAAAEAAAAAATANQAASDALDAANTANTSINGLISLGTDGSTYSVHGGNITANTITANEISSGYVYAGTVNASQINAGTLTGFTIQTAASGARAVLSGQNIGFFNSNETQAGIIAGGGAGGAVVNGVNVIAQQTLYLQGTGVEIKPTTGNLTVSSGSVIISTGGLSAGAIQGTSVSGTSVYSSGDISTDASLRRNALAGGGTTGASFTDGGNLVRTSSSQRYKQDIQLLDINLNDLYSLEPKTFRRIEEVAEHGESAKIYPGFIAEELAGTSLDKFVFYSKDEDGNPRPEGIHYPELTAALLLAIKNLNARIEALEGGV
jgi:hypothetical protein